MSYESLRFVSKVEVHPEDLKKQMQVNFKDEAEEYGSFYDGASRFMLSGPRQRSIELGSNAMYTVHTDFPDQFKKLVAVYGGDKDAAYATYQALQKDVPADWDKAPEAEEPWDPCECGEQHW